MNGLEFLARAIVHGGVRGLRPGDSLAKFDAELGGFHQVDNISGKKDRRRLRRDAGLLQATFVRPASWECGWMTLKLFRLVGAPDISDEVRRLWGVEFDHYTPWEALRREVLALPGIEFSVKSSVGEYLTYTVEPSGVLVTVIDDATRERGESPGHGDVWEIEISRRCEGVE